MSSLEDAVRSCRNALSGQGLLPVEDPREPGCLTAELVELLSSWAATLRLQLRQHASSAPPEERFDAWLLVGTLALARGRASRRFHPAVQAASAAIELQPRRVEGYLLRGQAYLLQGTNHPQWIPDALADFSRALILRPDHLVARLSRGLCHELPAHIQSLEAQRLREKGRLRRAETVIVAAEEGFLRALDAYEETLCLAPDWPRALLHRGACRARLGRLDAAREDFDRAQAALARDPLGLPVAKQTELFLERGFVLAALGRLDEALADFRRVVSASNGDAPEASQALADTAFRARRYDEAVDAYGSLIRNQQSLRQNLLQRAKCLFELRQIELARADVTRLLARDSADVEARFLRARCALEQGEPESALADCDHCLALEPRHSGCRRLREQAAQVASAASDLDESSSIR